MKFGWSFVLGSSLLALATSRAYADPTSLIGRFEYKGQTSWETTVHVQVVRVYSDLDRERLNEIRNQGYACEAVQSTVYRCHKVELRDEEPIERHLGRLQRVYGNLWLNFRPASGSPRLISKSPDMEQWEFDQPVESNGGLSDRVRVLIYKGENRGYSKLTLYKTGQDSPWLYLNVGRDSAVTMWAEFSESTAGGFDIHGFLLSLE